MKWIGQHIWDLISRFRSDVYLDSPTAGGSDPDKFLGIDSNNKIIYRTGAEVLSDVGGGTPLSTEQVQDIVGDMVTGNTETNISVTYEDGDGTLDFAATDTNTMGSGFTVSATTDTNETTITQGDDLLFTAGTGITCETTADGTVTITNTVSDTNTTYSAGTLLDLATTTFNVDLSELTDGTADVVGSADELVYLDAGSQKRKQIDEIKLGQFNNDQGWTSSTGDITGVSLTADDETLITDTSGAVSFILAGGEGIDTTTDESATVTIAAELASDSNKGVASFESDEFTVSSGVVNLKNAVSRVYGGTTIKVLPSDFLANEDAGVARFTQFADSGTTGLKPGAATLELWAFVDIPEGKKATHIDVYALSNHTISAHEIDINASGIGAALGTGTANTQLDITDVDATATNYLGIYVATGATSDRIYGALVTIADQ